MAELMTMANYARHRGVSKAAVSHAKARGRLVRSLVKQGGRMLVDVALADREWAANTDHSRSPMSAREKAWAHEHKAGLDTLSASDVGKFPEGTLETLSALLAHGAVILAHGNFDDVDAPGFGMCRMTPVTARLLGTQLLQLARDGGEAV